MNISELIQALSDIPNQEQEVYFACPSGDFWRTTIASKVDGVAMEYVKYSNYHQQNKIVDDDSEEATEAVVIY